MKCRFWTRCMSRVGVMAAMVTALGACGGGEETVSTVIPGSIFGIPVNLSNNAGSSTLRSVAMSGSTVLVAWQDDTSGNSEIFLARSTDGGASFGTPLNLSNNAGTSIAPSVAISGSTALVVWQDDDGTPDTPDNEIYVARSTNDGVSFEAPVKVSNKSVTSAAPSVGISGSTILVAWDDNTPTPGNSEIFLARSTDGGVSFATPVNVSNNPGNSLNPSVGISGSTALVAWYDNTPGNFEIFLVRSTDGGMNFGTPVNLSNNPGKSAVPSLAISGSTVLVAWYDNTLGNYEIYVARSTNGGDSFATPVNLSNNAGTSAAPSVAISSNTVLVAWDDNTPGNFEIFLARSMDGGVSFETPRNVSNNAGTSVAPSVAISGSTVLMAWYDNTPGNNEIFLVRSTDGGVNFGTRVNLSNNSGTSAAPSVAISGSTVLAAWQDDTLGNNEIFLARSVDGGVSFPTLVNVSNNAGTSIAPSVAMSGSTVLAAWQDDTPGNNEIFLASSVDGGVSFGTPVNVSNNAGTSIAPSVGISGSTALVAWYDNTPGNNEIFLARSTDGGANFGTPVNLSNNSGTSAAPSVAISGLTALVAWQDNTAGNNEIYVARSTDEGVNFGIPVNLSNNTGASLNPSVAISASTVLVAWQDDTLGNNEIFLARSTDAGVNFGILVNLSNDTGTSAAPSVVISGSTVLVAWQDDTSGNNEIYVARSTDEGVNFGIPVNLSNNTGASLNPSVAISAGTVLLAWQDNTPGNNEIFLARFP